MFACAASCAAAFRAASTTLRDLVVHYVGYRFRRAQRRLRMRSIDTLTRSTSGPRVLREPHPNPDLDRKWHAFDGTTTFKTHKLELKMKTTQTLLALVIAAVAPLAAQAESPDAIKFNDAPSTLSAAQVRADYLAMDKSGQRFGEAYPVAISNGASVLTRQEVRADYLAMDRSGQRFGEAYPVTAGGTTITSVAGTHADVR